MVEGSSVSNPFVAGVFRPTIFLPEGWVDGVDDDILSAVLHHEAAHIANGDLRWNMAYRISCAVLWPQPLLWLLQRRMSAVNEELCDQQVVAAGIPAPRYAECLLNLRAGIKSTACPALGIGAVPSRSSLGRRVEAILDPSARRAVISQRFSFSLKVGAVLLASCAALLFAHPSLGGRGVQDPFKNWISKPYGGEIQILSADGKPVEGGRAWLILVGETESMKPLVVRGSSIILPVGALDPHSSGRLVVQVEGHGVGFTNVWPAETKVTQIVLPHSSTLQGRLIDPDGRPAAGVNVKVRTMHRRLAGRMSFEIVEAEMIPELKLSATTAGDGSFQIEGLCPGATVDYQADDDRYAHLAYTDRVTMDANESLTKEPDAKLKFAAKITGLVTQNGKPVAGVKIGSQSQEADDGGNAVTDSNGRYELERLGAGSYNVIYDERERLDEKVTAFAHEGVKVQPGDVAKDVNFELIPGVLIEGHVTDAGGKPVDRAGIGIYGPAHPKSSAWVQVAWSDRAGHYQLRVPPGEQDVYTYDSRFDRISQTVTVKSGAKRVDFHVSPAQPAEAAPGDVPAQDAEQIKEPDESVPTPPVLSFGPGAPFFGPAKLEGGGELTLAFVQNDVTTPHTLWKPDGSPAVQSDVARSIDMHGFNREGPVRSLFLRVDVVGLERGSYDCLVKVPQTSTWNVWQTYGDQHNRDMDLASFRAAKTLEVTDMKFGIAYQPFRTLESGAIGEGPLFASLTKGEFPVHIAVRIPTGIEDREVQLAAYTTSGKRLRLRRWDNEDTKDKEGNLIRTFDFDGANPSDVARVELQVRDYEWVTFKGIHLYPQSRP